MALDYITRIDPTLDARIAALTPDKNYVLEFSAVGRSVDFGAFWNTTANTDVGKCFWEFMCKPLNGEYLISDGYGGRHAMLFGLGANVGARTSPHGNFWGGIYDISGATNASPIVIQTTAAHGWSTGAVIVTFGVLGNTAANVNYQPITVVDATHFSIDGTTGNGAYTSGGQTYYLQSYASDNGPAGGEWAIMAAGWDGTWITIYYNGVPISSTKFYSARRTSDPAAGAGVLNIGGSDHQNFIGNIAQVRGWENAEPFATGTDGSNIIPVAYKPEMLFSDHMLSIVPGTRCSFLAPFTKPHTHILDMIGLKVGKVVNLITGQATESYPAPQFVLDTGSPVYSSVVGPTTPAELIASVPSTPGSARVYDSFNRANRTLAFGQAGGLGATNAGSAGVKTWAQGSPTRVNYGQGNIGILTGRAAHLYGGRQCVAYVTGVGTADMEVRVDRGPLNNLEGINTGIAFRVQDQDNFLNCFTTGMVSTACTLHLGKWVAGVETANLINAACPTTAWLTMRIVCSGNSVSAYVDDLAGGWTQVGTTQTITNFNTQTGAGLWNEYVIAGMPCRWDNFLVL